MAAASMFMALTSSCSRDSQSRPRFAVTSASRPLRSALKPNHCFKQVLYRVRGSMYGGSAGRSEDITRRRSTAYGALVDNTLEVSKAEVQEDVHVRLNRLLEEFEALEDPRDRVRRLLEYGALLPPFAESARVLANRVMGCTAQVWLTAELGSDGRMYFGADSDSEIAKGFCACLINSLDGAFPEEVLQVKTEDLSSLNVGVAGGVNSRANTWHNVLISMQKKAQNILARNAGKPPVEPFPSLLVTAGGVSAQGSFAQAQEASI